MAITLRSLMSEEIKKMSFKDIFLSKDYENDLKMIIKNACLMVGHKKLVQVHIKYEPNDADVAYTDGNTIFVNFGSPFAKRLQGKPYLFHIYIVGLIAHELGHIFWTEFDDGEKYMKSLKKGELYPDIPKHPNASKFSDALQSKINRAAFMDICHCIDNILEDIYVNALQEQMLGGLYYKGIVLGNILVLENMKSIKNQKKADYYDFNIIINCLLTKLKAGTVVYGQYEDDYSHIVEAIFDVANKYIFRKHHAERVVGINLIICELWDYIEKMLTDIKEQSSNNSGEGSGGETSDSSSVSNTESTSSGSGNSDNGDGSDENGSDKGEENDSSGSSGSDNGLSEENEESDSESTGGSNAADSDNKDSSNTSDDSSTNSNSGGSSSSDSDEEIDVDILKDLLNKALEQLQGQTEESKNQSNSKLAGKKDINNSSQQNSLDEALKSALSGDKARLPQSTGEALAAPGSNQLIEEEYLPSGVAKQLSDLVKTLAENKAIQKNEETLRNDIAQEVEDIDFGNIHNCIDKHIYRVSSNEADSKIDYDCMVKDIIVTEKRLEKVVLRTIKSENLTGERRGRYYGKLLDNRRLYRPDLKIFKDKKNPKKEIDCAFYILVDVSGSMSGIKIESAKRTAVLFAEVCESLNIPLEVVGHSTYGWSESMAIYNFINYGSVDRNQKYSLAKMVPVGCNRDGAAIIYGCERLLKRPEQKKVFLIISDGQPNDGNYYGETAKSDMKHLKNKYSRDGITFVAAAIDSDKDFIKEIYGKNFLDITNLEEMPQTFGKILEKEILD